MKTFNITEEGLLSLNFIEETIKRWTVGVIKNYKMEQSMVSLTIPKFSITYQVCGYLQTI